jgi:hypothetical protein
LGETEGLEGGLNGVGVEKLLGLKMFGEVKLKENWFVCNSWDGVRSDEYGEAIRSEELSDKIKVSQI